MTTPAIVSPRLSAIVNDIRTNGGATWHPARPVPADGYMVSVPGHEETVPASQFSSLTLTAYEDARWDTVLNSENLYFGAWIDEGLVYLDLSLHTSSRDEAKVFGRLGGQLAIYEIATGESIYL